jgi:hypothetical protein
VIETVVYFFIYTFAGSMAGIVIGLMDADENRGAIVGVVIGLLMCGLEVLLSGSAFMLVNVFFYFFTGRFIGRGLASRVQAPVTR